MCINTSFSLFLPFTQNSFGMPSIIFHHFAITWLFLMHHTCTLSTSTELLINLIKELFPNYTTGVSGSFGNLNKQHLVS